MVRVVFLIFCQRVEENDRRWKIQNMLRIVVREISQIEPGEPGSCYLTGVLGSRGEDFEGFWKPEAAPEPAGLTISYYPIDFIGFIDFLAFS